jgi:predicted small lipoprotein YifL
MQSSTARLFIHIVLLASFASALCACGTKGPLYIPEQKYPQTTTQ